MNFWETHAYSKLDSISETYKELFEMTNTKFNYPNDVEIFNIHVTSISEYVKKN